MKFDRQFKNVTVSGVDNKIAIDYYKSVGNFLITKLKIPSWISVAIHLNFNQGFAPNQKGATLPDLEIKNHINVYVDKMDNRADLLRAICHEFIHVEQLASEKLILHIKNKTLIAINWKGNSYSVNEIGRESDWELEAYSKEKTLIHDVIENVGNLIF